MSEKRRRTYQVAVRLTPNEYTALLKIATNLDVSPQAAIRAWIFDTTMTMAAFADLKTDVDKHVVDLTDFCHPLVP